MFCPKCTDEFRPGFTHCAKCDVDLVDELPREKESRKSPAAAPAQIVMVEYCGFFSMQEAQHARSLLREEQIRSEIVIREPFEVNWDEPPQDEYWVRIERDRAKEAHMILGAWEAEEQRKQQQEAAGFACSECGQNVAAEASSCPNCGAGFDDD